jgi:hypothetical protein
MKIDPTNKKLLMAILSISILMVISSCGGESDSSTTGNPQTAGTISGSVSGTTILALDDDGMIVASDNTKGRVPDLDLDNDSVKESYSFIINDLPLGVRLRIYLVSNEGVFPMYFDNNGTETNILSLSSSTDINLGFIDTAGEEATPEINPLISPDVVPEGVDLARKIISGAKIDDFTGTWIGAVPYLMADGESGTAQVTLTLSVNGNQLVGTMYESIEGWTVSITGSESNGVFEFDLPASEPTNPDCAKWNVSFTATLNETLDQMDLTGGGIFCGLGGGKSGSFSGYLTSN